MARAPTVRDYAVHRRLGRGVDNGRYPQLMNYHVSCLVVQNNMAGPLYRRLKDDFAAIEMPIYDLMRLLLAAAHLQEESDEDLHMSAHLIVDLAAQKAEESNDQYQKSFPGEGINSLVHEGAAQ
jgi:hypothetical protein